MPSLLDHIDRFSYTAQAIRTASLQAVAREHGPHVHAVLHTGLGDRARDVDASELGLFTLVQQPSSTGTHTDEDDASGVQKSEVARVEFPGATPLRKPAGGMMRGVEKEKEPEVYAEAALKYLDRYQSIRPMPRARQEVTAIIERLNSLRSGIEKLSEVVDQNDQAGSTSVTTLKDEERRIQELNLRIKQLKARKEVLLKKQKPSGSKEEDAFWAEPAPRSNAKSKLRQSLIVPSSSNDDDSLILDASMDMGDMIGDMSMDSIADAPMLSPPPRAAAKKEKAPERRQEVPALRKTIPSRSVDVEVPSPREPPEQKCIEPEPEPELQREGQGDQVYSTYEEEDEKTVVLKKPPTTFPSPSPPPRDASPPRLVQPSVPSALPGTPTREDRLEQTPKTPIETSGPSTMATPGTGRKSKYKITTDVERIVAKIWSTVGDVIMPGHPFNTASAATTNKPPRAKETLALLQNVSTQSPPPSSPSTHSTLSLTDHTASGQPSAHQILTAHLLLTLLSVPPSYSLPLAKAKEALASKGLGGPPVPGALTLLSVGIGGGQALETRALYGCVAKRLLKIDRGGREQLVRFDV